jgi:pimeloyl-ACP methyl ester carboxylesterase
LEALDKFVRTIYIGALGNNRKFAMPRRFWDVTTPQFSGQLHVREGNVHTVINAPPLIMLHAAPGSALMLSRLQEKFAQCSYAIDLPGMGDSDALNHAQEPTIADYTEVIAAGINKHIPASPTGIDVYGTLSGVRVALALCNHSDVKVRRVILDGIGIPKPEQMTELLEAYAPPFVADINGNHLLNTFMLCRDQYLFYPWYARDAEHRRPTGLPSATALHAKTMESLKSAAAFRPLIRAAFREDVESALRNLKQLALISADASAVRPDYPVLEYPPVEPLTCSPDLLDKRAVAMMAFLAA